MAEEKKKVADNSKTEKATAVVKPLFAWKSPDSVQHERSTEWYLIIVVATLALAAIFYWLELWTGMAVVILAAIVLIVTARLKPKEITCAVFPEGVVIDEKAYEFKEFKSFWISIGELPKLKLQRIGKIAGMVDLPLLNSDIDQLRLFFSKHLPEEAEKGEDLVDIVNRIIKF